MSIKSDLNYLEETKGLIKEAIINKGQNIDDNTPFRDYVQSIENISTEPTKPMGIKVYQSVVISNSQTDLVNYYIDNLEDFTNLNSYQFRFHYMNNNTKIPEYGVLQVIDDSPCLMRYSLYNVMTRYDDNFYFNPSYTQAFIDIATSLGLYNMYVTPFLNAHNITEAELKNLNGWYDSQLTSLSNITINNTALIWAIKVTVQEFLTDSWGLQNVKDYIDFDETNINITLTDLNDEDDAITLAQQMAGLFLTAYAPNTAYSQPNTILEGHSAFTVNGLIAGNIPNNGTLSYNPRTNVQNIPAGYTTGGTINAVTSSIDLNIQAANIKSGVQILNITGNYTSDANATAAHILSDKIAYVNGQRVTGIMTPHIGNSTYINGISAPNLNLLNISYDSSKDKIYISGIRVASGYWDGNAKALGYFDKDRVYNLLGLTPNVIKKDVTILGITGTYEGIMSQAEYNEAEGLTENILGNEEP